MNNHFEVQMYILFVFVSEGGKLDMRFKIEPVFLMWTKIEKRF